MERPAAARRRQRRRSRGGVADAAGSDARVYGEEVFGGEPAEAGEEDYDPADQETVDTIKELLETRVRPAVAADGGDITFRSFKDGIVYLNMRGACAGCPSSTATLRHGIQNLLKHFLPDVEEVRAVT